MIKYTYLTHYTGNGFIGIACRVILREGQMKWFGSLFF